MDRKQEMEVVVHYCLSLFVMASLDTAVLAGALDHLAFVSILKTKRKKSVSKFKQHKRK